MLLVTLAWSSDDSAYLLVLFACAMLCQHEY